VKMGSISEFIERNFRHFNAAVLKDAADAYMRISIVVEQ